MQNFHDPVTNSYWSFDEDVAVSTTDEGRVFHTAEGQHLEVVPTTLVPVHEIPVVIQPPPVPQVVSRFQGREAMWQTPHGDASLFEAAEAIINGPDTPATYRRAWADLQEFRRDSEMLIAVATALGLSNADLDAIFILADGIKA